MEEIGRVGEVREGRDEKKINLYMLCKVHFPTNGQNGNKAEIRVLHNTT